MLVHDKVNVIVAEEAAAILGVDKSTVTRQAASGILPIVRKLDGPRGAYLFDRAEIERVKNERNGVAA